MNEQPTALRLADELADYTGFTVVGMDQAAAELRRLHVLNGKLMEALNSIASTRASHLAELDPQRAKRIARAAIKAVEERK